MFNITFSTNDLILVVSLKGGGVGGKKNNSLGQENCQITAEFTYKEQARVTTDNLSADWLMIAKLLITRFMFYRQLNLTLCTGL